MTRGHLDSDDLINNRATALTRAEMTGDWKTAESLLAGLTQDQRDRVGESAQYQADKANEEHSLQRNLHTMNVIKDGSGHVTGFEVPALLGQVTADKAMHVSEAAEETKANMEADKAGTPRIWWGNEKL